ncbi:peptidoglycan editing factor PgeF [Parachitinimonas caeni]|uniref:Purine nucleoside phosphorylase n=1 Tax=Parachitinimonas caeni TaxID=3031301 RepID=A0ABT7DU15_9NEIS|nr:peptidoglycan editing factor PgeF [Parachitinimonas caeni]MDK2123574.1 peptidoglycan editing factor PgeF [Parachitinimonas caeni]
MSSASGWLNEVINPLWPAPATVRAMVTTRGGGVSLPPFASLNLGDHVGDDPNAVLANRRLLRQALPAEPLWLKQVHGIQVVDAAAGVQGVEADAVFARQPGVVCAIMTADCLPVLLTTAKGDRVAAVHAGWRGLCDGVIEAAITAMGGEDLMAWLGPAIGPGAFEVGPEVREAFLAKDAAASQHFRSADHNGKWLADIYGLARQRLHTVGVTRIFGGGDCTVTDAERFFSYRRDKTTGRMASLIWLA